MRRVLCRRDKSQDQRGEESGDSICKGTTEEGAAEPNPDCVHSSSPFV